MGASAWSLFAFGGAYAWTTVPLVLAAAALAIVVRPSLVRATPLLDLALLVSIACVAVQAVPLPPAVRRALSPNADVLDAVLRPGFDTATARPLSLDPSATLTWLPATLAVIVIFWSARDLFARGGTRRTIRGVAWIGLAVSIVAVVHRWSAPHLLYWYWRPLEPGGTTMVPFVNRNHMATWLLLALPTLTGYILARGAVRRDDRSPLAMVARTVEEPASLWLAAAAFAMLGAVVVSQSRSAVIALGVAAAFGALVARSAGRAVRRRWIVVLAAAIAIVAVSLTSADALVVRFVTVQTPEMGGRGEIWRQTLPIVRDFALTGVGAGAYPTAMLVYQTGDRLFFFNQAHDQYLQFAAEGGLLFVVPIITAMVAFGAAAARRLRGDRSPAFWIRVGATSAIVAVAVQSLWETGLRMPANAVLCAIVAAMAISEPRSGGGEAV